MLFVWLLISIIIYVITRSACLNRYKQRMADQFFSLHTSSLSHVTSGFARCVTLRFHVSSAVLLFACRRRRSSNNNNMRNFISDNSNILKCRLTSILRPGPGGVRLTVRRHFTCDVSRTASVLKLCLYQYTHSSVPRKFV